MVEKIKKNPNESPKILYIAYWGALEQLGQSLIVPAVKKLAQMGAELTLITFEKSSDLVRFDEMNRVRRMLTEDKIEWIPLQYHKSPKIPATVFDIIQCIARGIHKRVRKHFDIVHARTYIGGLIGLSLAPLIGSKFVYHNEGFYPDEQVDGGVWIKDSRAHRIAKSLEKLMYARADGIIALSFRAKEIIERLSEVSRKKTSVIVVPSCVDLERFSLPITKPKFSEDETKFVYIGNVGPRYILNKIGEFTATLQKVDSKVKLQIYSKTDIDFITTVLDDADLPREAWSLEAIAYSEMASHLINYRAGLFFLTEGISEHGCSPTKIGEYWAVGLPVVTTPNVSDTDEIIRRERVGVIIKGHKEESYLEAYKELRHLLKDPELSMRCRRAAETHYALNSACERQFALYNDLIEN